MIAEALSHLFRPRMPKLGDRGLVTRPKCSTVSAGGHRCLLEMFSWRPMEPSKSAVMVRARWRESGCASAEMLASERSSTKDQVPIEGHCCWIKRSQGLSTESSEAPAHGPPCGRLRVGKMGGATEPVTIQVLGPDQAIARAAATGDGTPVRQLAE